jgi:hypothetical protein
MARKRTFEPHAVHDGVSRESCVNGALLGEPQRLQQDETGHLLDIITSSREHNNANVLSLGSRFVSLEEAKEVVKNWLAAPFSGEERHGQGRAAELPKVGIGGFC